MKLKLIVAPLPDGTEIKIVSSNGDHLGQTQEHPIIVLLGQVREFELNGSGVIEHRLVKRRAANQPHSS